VRVQAQLGAIAYRLFVSADHRGSGGAVWWWFGFGASSWPPKGPKPKGNEARVRVLYMYQISS
jgi:hypothetical protein